MTNNNKPLNGKVALVTGGSRGIGAAIARKLAEDGAKVALTYNSSPDAAEKVAADIRAAGGEVSAIKSDAGSTAAALDAVERTVLAFGGIDILVNNAGVYDGGPVETLTAEQFDRSFAVNVRGPLLTSQAAVKHMKDGGRIINIGSCLGERVGMPGLSIYAGTKFALVGVTRGLARDLAPRAITVNLVQPGPIDTDMNPANSDQADAIRATVALGEYGNPEDIAMSVAFLAGEGGRFITGSAITVDGGVNI